MDSFVPIRFGFDNQSTVHAFGQPAYLDPKRVSAQIASHWFHCVTCNLGLKSWLLVGQEARYKRLKGHELRIGP